MPEEPPYHARIYGAVSLATPPARMVLLDFGFPGEDSRDKTIDVNVFPVVAIRSVVVTDYYRPHSEGYRRLPPDHVLALRDGWKSESMIIEENYVIVDFHDYGLCTFDIALFGVDAVNDCRPVACPWPVEQDRVRLTTMLPAVIRSIHGHRDECNLPFILRLPYDQEPSSPATEPRKE